MKLLERHIFSSYLLVNNAGMKKYYLKNKFERERR